MSEPIDPRELLATLVRHKRKSITCGLLVMGAVVVATALMQPRFRSQAMLYLRLGRENVSLDPTAAIGMGSVVAIPQGREDEMNSVVEMLRSRTLAERIVDKIGPGAILGTETLEESAQSAPPEDTQADQVSHGLVATYAWRLLPGPEQTPRELALEKFGKRLSVSAPKRSTVVHVVYDGPSPEVAQEVVRQLIDLYLEDHVRLNRTAGSHDFFVEQTDQIRGQLVSAESRLRDLKNQTGMASVEERRKILVERIGRLEDDLLKNSTELASLDAELASLNQKLDRIPQTRVTQRVSGLPNQAVDLMRQQLYTLQLKEQDLLSIYKEDTRQVKEIRRQIQEAEAILAKEEDQRTQSTDSSDPTFQQLYLTLHSRQTLAASVRARLEKSKDQLAAAHADLSQLNSDEMRIVQMRRDVDLQESNYRKYAENLEQARIDQALKLERISNIGVAQPATYEPRQVRPQVALQLGAGLIAAIVTAIALAFVAEYLERSMQATRSNLQEMQPVTLARVSVDAESNVTVTPTGSLGAAGGV